MELDTSSTPIHRRLLALTRDTRFPLIITVLSGLLSGLFTIGQAHLVSSTVNGVFLEGQSLAQVFHWLQLILIIIAGRALLTWVNEVSANAVAVRIKTDLRERLFNHILKLGPAYTRGQRTGELTTAAVEGIEALDAYYSQYLPQLVITTLVPISILIFVFPIDLLSGFVLLITAPLIPFFMIMIGKGAEIITRRQYETLSRLSAHFLDSLQGLTTLKLFGRSRSHAKNIAKASDQYRDTTLRVLQITFLSALVLELLATLSTAVIAVEIGFRLLYAKMEFQQAFFILILAPEFYLPLRMLGARFHAGMSGTTAAKRIFEILDIEVREQRLLEKGESEITRLPFSSLQFSNLSYTYPNETAPALENINLKINAGQHIALVGKTGSGKSTLADLLLGFIQPTAGKISIHPSSFNIHHSISWVPQRPHLFHDTLAANIKLGKPNATREEVIEAAKAAHLHDFIETLPNKYETVIGESGARLSGGQAQRLALARAFLKNSSILILDEPTSSLDPETETLLEESARRLMQGRTVITIAHRLNTIFKADEIIVIEKGRIVEQGSHDELVNQNGAYAEMVKTYEVTSNKPQIKGLGPPNAELQPSTLNFRSAINHQSQTVNRNSSIVNRNSSIVHRNSSIVNRNSSTLFRLLSFLNGSWRWVALSVLLNTLTIGSSVALIGTSAWLISTAALHPSIADLGVSVVGVRFFGISRGIFRYLERLVSHNVTFRLLARLRVWFYEKLEPLAPARLMDYKAGDLLARVIGDIETLEDFYVRVISPSLTAIIVAIGVSIFFASFYPTIAYILIGFFFTLGFILPLLSQAVSRQPGQRLITQRANIQSQLVDGIQGLADILAFGRGKDRADQISKAGTAYRSTQMQMAVISGISSGFSVFLTNFGLWLVLFLVIPQVAAGNIKGVMLGTFALMTFASFEAVNPLPPAAQMWSSSREAAGRLFEIVDVEPEIVVTREQRLRIGSSNNLQFSNLTFSYPNQSTPAIQDISFTIPEGKSIAIVGPTGAGKSTIANLLLRFWDYDSGEISWGGKSLKSLNQDEVRKRCALISSNSYFFNTSIRENLRLARPSINQEEMEAAARNAQIHEFIAGLPKGYDTFIGEQGSRLSGGERQRLGIARALLKDAPVLILDEPTANLDPATEKNVLDTLFGIMRNKTSLLITHRLAGLENMDEVLVMDHGRIVERGRHDDLLNNNGVYRLLWSLQNRILHDRQNKDHNANI